MITAPAGVKVLVATKPVDFRKGADGLVALVREQIQHDPFCGAIFIASRPFEDSGVGRVRAGFAMEATGARRFPVAANLHAREIAQPTATS
jgi:hypothetical protein